MSEDKNSKKYYRRFIAVIVILLLIIIAGIIFIIMNGGAESAQESGNIGGIGLTIDKNAGEFVAVEQESKPGVAIPGWGSITLSPNTTEITVDFFNPEENADWYYLTFELRLPDNSAQGYEVLYASQLVEPGKHIQKITLNHGLAAGEYEAIMHVQPYTMDGNMTATNNADMKTTLFVKEGLL